MSRNIFKLIVVDTFSSANNNDARHGDHLHKIQKLIDMVTENLKLSLIPEEGCVLIKA